LKQQPHKNPQDNGQQIVSFKNQIEEKENQIINLKKSIQEFQLKLN
jgi:hypothetical protein